MAHIEDRWHRPGRVPTSRYGSGLRWRVRYQDGTRTERSRSFAKRTDAERFVEKLISHACLVPGCRVTSVTEEPVLLCQDHRDLLVSQCIVTPRRVRTPVVYFARNGSRVKIGWTTDLRQRMVALSLPMGSVALTMTGGPELERQLHDRFRTARIAGSEWFDVTPAIEAFVAAKKAEAVAREVETEVRAFGGLMADEHAARQLA